MIRVGVRIGRDEVLESASDINWADDEGLVVILRCSQRSFVDAAVVQEHAKCCHQGDRGHEIVCYGVDCLYHRFLFLGDSTHQFSINFIKCQVPDDLYVMIGATGSNFLGPVNLLDEDESDELVGKYEG